MDGAPSEPLTERIVLRPTLGGLDVVDFEEDEPFDIIRFHRWRARARFGEVGDRPRWEVARRIWRVRDIGLFRGRALHAVARRTKLLPATYTVGWDGGRFILAQEAGESGWRLHVGERTVGAVKRRPFEKGARDIETPPDTPDEISIFVGCVVEITRRYSIVRLLASAAKGVPDY